jgi:predicted transglutaminase-like cysteine proteinase
MPAIILDQMHWAQMEQVQQAVNQRVTAQSDRARFGVDEYWEPAGKTGDCEDIALAKRAQLIEMGWPADSLRMAVVINERREMHAVLTVDVTSQKGAPATYVMDNRTPHVEPWKNLADVGYMFLERAKPGSAEWTSVDPKGLPLARLFARYSTASGSPARVESQ